MASTENFTNNAAKEGSIQVFGTHGTVNIEIGGTNTTKDIPKPPFYMLPPLAVSRFIRRPDLMEKIEEGLESGGSPAIMALVGMGGQGKTQLALEYCRAGRASELFKAILWVDASSNSSIQRSLEAILAKIAAVKPARNLETMTSQIKDIIEGWKFRWIMVFDNYDLPDDTINISMCFPQCQYGIVIITSRCHNTDRFGTDIEILGMTEDQSLELLLSRSRLPPTVENSRSGKQIAQRLGFLPLAIDQAGAYIRSQKLDFTVFMRHFTDRKAHILQYTPAFTEYRKNIRDTDGEIALNVFTTLELSLTGLQHEERESVEDFLTSAAFLDFTNISETLFMSEVHIEAANWKKLYTSNGQWEHYKYRDLVTGLNRVSLIQSIYPDDVIRFSLHPLVAEWLKLRKSEDMRRFHTKVGCTKIGLSININEMDSMELSERQYWLAQADACSVNQHLVLEVLGSQEHLLSLSLLNIGYLYRRNFRFEEAEEMYKLGFSSASNVPEFGDQKSLQFRALRSRGVLYFDQGELEEAEKYLSLSLDVAMESQDENDPQVLDILDILGCVYLSQGRYEDSERIYLRCLSGKEKVLGQSSVLTLDTVNNIGALYSKQGKFKEAEPLYARALEGYEKLLHPNHVYISNTRRNLGEVYNNIGKAEQAENMYLQALYGYEKIFGKFHGETLKTVTSLAFFYRYHKMWSKADQYFARAVVSHEQTSGPNGSHTLGAVFNLATLYADSGRAKEAEPLFMRALNGFEEISGPESDWVPTTAKTMAAIYQHLDRLEDAEKMLVRVAEWHENSLGETHPSTLRALEELGVFYRKRGTLKEAEPLLLFVLEEREQALGPTHKDTVYVEYELAVLYSLMSKWGQSIEMYKRAAIGHESLLESDNILESQSWLELRIKACIESVRRIQICWNIETIRLLLQIILRRDPGINLQFSVKSV